MFRRSRETIIALRARHQAFRIAAEVGQPHMEPPPQPQRVLPLLSPPPPIPDWWETSAEPRRPYIHYAPVDDDEFTPPQPQSPVARVLTSDLVLSLLMILTGVGVILLCKYG